MKVTEVAGVVCYRGAGARVYNHARRPRPTPEAFRHFIRASITTTAVSALSSYTCTYDLGPPAR
jgi:hypothetical protein